MNETNLRQIIVEAVRHALKEGYNKRTATEEKVKQLGEKYAYCTLTKKEIAEQSSIEMAQWKNNQFFRTY